LVYVTAPDITLLLLLLLVIVPVLTLLLLLVLTLVLPTVVWLILVIVPLLTLLVLMVLVLVLVLLVSTKLLESYPPWLITACAQTVHMKNMAVTHASIFLNIVYNSPVCTYLHRY
jgi:hypothetical protein